VDVGRVVFFVTTARSGTQWAAAKLRDAYPELLVVEHEPLKYRYEPRTHIRDIGRLRRLAGRPDIRAHLDHIHDIAGERTYVEVGFPAFAMAPILREEFGDRLRIIQLTRHPVRVAASIVTHHWFDGTRPDIERCIVPTPLDPGSALHDYAGRWNQMSAFEKALCFWYEVHTFGVEQEAMSPPGTFARFQFERILTDPDVQSQFCDVLGLPPAMDWEQAPAERVDKNRHHTSQPIDWSAAEHLPEVRQLASELGYELDEVDQAELAHRYACTPFQQLVDDLKRVVRRRMPTLHSVGVPLAAIESQMLLPFLG
jgi:hypothetical protein